jgi:hypothetical protein
MKIYILFIFNLIYTISFCQIENSFDFPILIKKVDLTEFEINFDSITEYQIDSIFLPNVGKSFKYLTNINDTTVFSYINNYNKTVVTIDFDGYCYVRIKNEIYYVVNPYIGRYSFYKSLPMTDDMVTDGVYCLDEIFVFDSKGEMISSPFKISNILPILRY